MHRNAWITTKADAGLRLDKWLAADARLGSRRRAFEALSKGRVFVEEVEQTGTDAGRPLVAGMAIRLWMDRPGSASRRGTRKVHGLDILFEDDALIVLDKPAGLLTVPLPYQPEDPSLSARVAEHWRSHRRREPLVVHRIDRDTSGVVVFAHTPEAWSELKQRFRRREPERHYLAVVHGRPEPAAGTWRSWIRWDDERHVQVPCRRDDEGAKEAVTRYEVREVFAEAALVALVLGTGRQHQLRVQAMCHEHPLLGERIYVGSHGARVGRAFTRQALHASSLAFPHPVSGKPVTFEAPLPGDLRGLLQRLRSPPDQARSSQITSPPGV